MLSKIAVDSRLYAPREGRLHDRLLDGVEVREKALSKSDPLGTSLGGPPPRRVVPADTDFFAESSSLSSLSLSASALTGPQFARASSVKSSVATTSSSVARKMARSTPDGTG
ncbi:hypothetical protein ISCGN_007647 [Ixodes scapularis]